jgi:hypothetical protein
MPSDDVALFRLLAKDLYAMLEGHDVGTALRSLTLCIDAALVQSSDPERYLAGVFGYLLEPHPQPVRDALLRTAHQLIAIKRGEPLPS